MTIQFTFLTNLVSGGNGNVPLVDLHYIESDAILRGIGVGLPTAFVGLDRRTVSTQRSGRRITVTLQNVAVAQACAFSLRDRNNKPVWRSKIYDNQTVQTDFQIQLIDFDKPYEVVSADLRELLRSNFPSIERIVDTAGFKHLKLNRLIRVSFNAREEFSITMEGVIMKNRNSDSGFYISNFGYINDFEPFKASVRIKLLPSEGFDFEEFINIQIVSARFTFLNPAVQSIFDTVNGIELIKKQLTEKLKSEMNSKMIDFIKPEVNRRLPNADKVSSRFVSLLFGQRPG